jgi:hypothetical protein
MADITEPQGGKEEAKRQAKVRWPGQDKSCQIRPLSLMHRHSKTSEVLLPTPKNVLS